MSIEFENDSVDVGVQKIEYYIDKDSSLKFLAPYIASSNFNGTIPIVDTMLTASFLKPGMTIAFNGGGVGDQYFPIVSIEFDDLDLTDSPTNLITIKYLDADSIVTSKEIDKSESVAVRYEDWDDKDLGSLGWSITSGGNAIFTNVGVRGEIEATTLDVGGVDGITYDGNTVTIGASVIINAPLTVRASGNFIVSGSAAQDIISNNTTITGGNIATGKIKSTGYSGPGTGSAFSTAGMSINLDDGSIAAPNFKIDSDGNAHFKGTVQSASGSLGGFSLSASQISIAGFTMSTASGIYLGNNQQFKVDLQGNLLANSASMTGNIVANSGEIKKLTIGAGKSYPIINLIGTASVVGATESGNFILTLSSDSKDFYPGDYFYINGANTSGSAFQGGVATTASVFFNSLSLNKDGTWSSPYKYKIITASYSSTPNTDSYFCRLAQSGISFNYDFSQVTASSGSINFGYIYFGEYSTYSLSGGTFIDGIILNTVGPGTFFQTYVPDYIDLSGKFRLGKGNITFDGNNLFVKGDITANSGKFLGSVGVNGAGSIYAGNDPNTGQRVILTSSGLFGFDSGNINIFSLPITGSPTIAGFTVVNTGLTGSGQMANMIFGNRGDNAYNITVRGDKTGGQAAAIYTTVNGVATTSNANNGFYLDDTGKMRLAGPNGSLTFDGTDLSVTGNITATSGSFSGWLKSASITGGIISSGSFVGGILQSAGYSGATDGSSFSTTGTHLNLNTGAITAKQFRIDSSGNATFGGTLNAAGGTFSGNLSAVGGTFTGDLSGNQITSGTISADRIDVTNLTVQNLSTQGGGGAYVKIGPGTTSTNDRIIFETAATKQSSAPYIYGFSRIISQWPAITMNGGTTLSNSNAPFINIRWLDDTSSEIIYSVAGGGIFSGHTFRGKINSDSDITATNFIGNLTGNISGNAATVTNGVYTNVSYNDPAWITALAGSKVTNAVLTTGTYNNPAWLIAVGGSKITGNISGNANNITAYNINQNLGTGNSPTFYALSALTTQPAGTGTHYLHWTSTNGTVTRSTSLPSGSSEKLKTDIELFNVNPLWTASVSDIYTFKYKSDVEDFGEDAPTQLGIIIDYISNIPELSPMIFEVNSASAIDYSKFGVLLIPTINYLINKINLQEEIISDLQSRMLQLESQLGG